MPRGRNDYEHARIAGRLWTPAELRGTSELYGWFDGSDASTISVATGISTWRDKSGFNRDATQATTGNQPAWSPTGWSGNGQSCITPDGVNDRFGWTGPSYVGADGFCCFASVNIGTSANYRALVSGVTGGPTFDISPSNVLRVLRGFQALISASASVVPNGLNVLGWEAATNYTGTWINGTGETTSTNPALTAGSSSLFHEQVSDFWETTARQLVLTKKLAAYARRRVEGFLAWDAGIQNKLAANHPFRTRPPLIGD